MSCTSSGNDSRCANCGKGEEASLSLKSCTACKMVRYCSRECQIAHRPQHKKECRKRAAELYDEKLFKQPPLVTGDCPICFIRIPTLCTGSKYMSCCGKLICSGCILAPRYDNQGNEVDNRKCPFCRTPWHGSHEELMERMNKRIEKGDAYAIYQLGNYYVEGSSGFAQDYSKALEQWHRAGELGHAMAYNSIGYAYKYGEGLEVDKKKAKHYYELAAMGGNEMARHNLGATEQNAGNMERALKHYMLAAEGGYTDSLKRIQDLYKKGFASKDDYTQVLKSYQAYLSEIKSDQRDKAAVYEDYQYY